MRKHALALACTLLLSALAGAQDFDKLLPDSTIAYLSVENFSRTKERFEKSPLRALWDDEQIQKFAEAPIKKFSEWIDQTRQEDGFSLEDVLEVVDGQVMLAMTGPDAEKHLVLLADLGGNVEKARELLERVRTVGVDDKGYTRNEEEFRGVTIVTMTGEEKDGEAADSDSTCIAGSILITAPDLETLKQVLVRKDAGEEEGTLRAREIYQRVRTQLGARADMVAYVDGANVMKIFKEGEHAADEETWKIMAALGITSIEGFGAQFSLEPDRVVTNFFVPVAGKKKGILKLFDGPNSALTPPTYAPPNADGAGAFALDINAIWKEARRVADEIEPGTTAQMDAMFEMMKQQVGVDIQADIIASFGEELTYYLKLPEAAGGAAAAPGGANPLQDMPDFVMGLQVKNKQRLETALNNLLAQAGPMVMQQEYLGVKMHVINTPMGVAPVIALMPDRLLFGLKVEDVKDVIGRFGKEAKGLLDNREYSAALGELPAERIAVSVTNEAKTMRQSMFGFWTGVQMGTDNAVSMDSFPSVETLEKYLGVSTTCMVNADDGIVYTYTLRLKPQE